VLLIASHPHLSSLRRPFSSTPIPKAPSLLKIQNIHAPHFGHIRVIKINSPENYNALSLWLLQELGQEIRALSEGNQTEQNRFGQIWEPDISGEEGEGGDKLPSKAHDLGPTRCLVLASENDQVFCSGADLKERQRMTRDE
jgi:methylglutaconyl-CoA hydratase